MKLNTKYVVDSKYFQLVQLSRYVLNIIFLFFSVSLPQYVSAQVKYGTEEELIKAAAKFFADDNYAEALPLYSQLLSLHPAEKEYNFKYGVCQLLGDRRNPEKPISYLSKAAKEYSSVDPTAFYYLGLAYHQNFRFAEAIIEYNKYKATGKASLIRKLDVDRQIEMCHNGQMLLSRIKDIYVMEKRDQGKDDFYRSYNLQGFGGKFLMKPDEFNTKVDKKKKEASIVFLPDTSNVVYFSSYGEKDEGQRDIYYKKKLGSGLWSEAVRMSDKINTPYDEDYPFITPDGRTLFFCSKGHNSMGGYDIFKVIWDRDNMTWSDPVNMDFAINTPYDDILFATDANQEEARFASDRGNVQGQLSVYKVRIDRRPREKYELTLAPKQDAIKTDVKYNESIALIKKKSVLEVNTKGEHLTTDAFVSASEPFEERAAKVSVSTASNTASSTSFETGQPVQGSTAQTVAEKAPSAEMAGREPAEAKPVYLEEKFTEAKLPVDVGTLAVADQVVKYNDYGRALETRANDVLSLSTDYKRKAQNTTNERVREDYQNKADELEAQAHELMAQAEVAFQKGDQLKYEAGSNKEMVATPEVEMVEHVARVDVLPEPERPLETEIREDFSNEDIRTYVKEQAEQIEKEKEQVALQKEAALSLAKHKMELSGSKMKEAEEIDVKASTLEDQNERYFEISRANRMKSEAEQLEKEAEVAYEQAKDLNMSLNKKAKELVEAEETIGKVEGAIDSGKSVSMAVEETKKTPGREKSPQQPEHLRETAADYFNKSVELQKESKKMETQAGQLKDQASQESDSERKSLLIKEAEQLQQQSKDKRQEADLHYTIGNETNQKAVAMSGPPEPAAIKIGDAQVVGNPVVLAKKDAKEAVVQVLDGATRQQELLNKQAAIYNQYARTARATASQKKMKAQSAGDATEKQQLLNQAATSERIASVFEEKSVLKLAEAEKIEEQVTVLRSDVDQGHMEQALKGAKVLGREIASQATAETHFTIQDVAHEIGRQVSAQEAEVRATTVQSKRLAEQADSLDGAVYVLEAQIQNAKKESEKPALIKQKDDLQRASKEKKSSSEQLASKATELRETQTALREQVSLAGQVAEELSNVLPPTISEQEQALASENSDLKEWAAADIQQKLDDAQVQLKTAEVELDVVDTGDEHGYSQKDIEAIANELRENEDPYYVEIEVEKYKYAGISNERKFYANNKKIEKITNDKYNYSEEEVEKLIRKKIMLEEEARFFFDKAMDMRTDAEQTSDIFSMKVMLEQALDYEANALSKQQMVMEVYKTGDTSRIPPTSAVEKIIAEKKLFDNVEKLKKEFMATADKEAVKATSKQLDKQFKKDYNRSMSLVNLKEYDAALDLLFKLNGQKENNANILFHIGYCYINNSLVKDKALEYFEKAKSNVSINYINYYQQTNAPIYTYYYLGVIHQYNNDFQKALDNYYKFKSYINAQNEYDYMDVMEEINWQIQICERAIAQINNTVTQETDDKIMNRIEKMVKSNLPRSDEDIKEKFRTGMQYVSMGEFNRALPIFLGLVEKKPDNANFNYLAGRCMFIELGNKVLAKPYFQKASTSIARNYKNVYNQEQAPDRAFYFLGSVYQFDDNCDSALVYFNKYKELLSPGDPEMENILWQIELCETKTFAQQRARELEEMKERERIERLKAKQLEEERRLAALNAPVVNLPAEELEVPVATLEEHVATVEEPAESVAPFAAVVEPVAVEEEPLAVADELVAIVEQPLAVIEKPTVIIEKPALVVEKPAAVVEEVEISEAPDENEEKVVEVKYETIDLKSTKRKPEAEKPSAVAVTVPPVKPLSPQQEGIVIAVAADPGTMVSAYNEDNPIPVNPAMPGGLLFRVQIGAFSGSVKQDLFVGLSPISGENTSLPGVTRYTAGNFSDLEAANKAQNQVRGIGYNDAFVIAFYNGKRITIAQARALLRGEQVDLGAGTGLVALTTGEQGVSSAVQGTDIAEVKGLKHSVQVGYFRLNADLSVLRNLNPLYREDLAGGTTRYLTGLYARESDALAARDRVRAAGHDDAFVVAIHNGTRLSVAEARQMIAGGQVNTDLMTDQEIRITAPSDDAGRVPGLVEGAVQENSGLANDVSTVKGLFYSVQVGVVKQPVGPEKLKNIEPIYVSKAANGMYRHVAGIYTKPSDAEKAKAAIVARGIEDAFVVAFHEGQKVSVADARRLQDQGLATTASPVSVSQSAAVASERSENVTFQVQLGAFRSISDERLSKIIRLLSGEVQATATADGVTVYTSRGFAEYTAALELRNRAVEQGIDGAFIIALRNGQRISVSAALGSTAP